MSTCHCNAREVVLVAPWCANANVHTTSSAQELCSHQHIIPTANRRWLFDSSHARTKQTWIQLNAFNATRNVALRIAIAHPSSHCETHTYTCMLLLFTHPSFHHRTTGKKAMMDGKQCSYFVVDINWNFFRSNEACDGRRTSRYSYANMKYSECFFFLSIQFANSNNFDDTATIEK